MDEHWSVGVHRSASSSRTGDAHFRALHNRESEVRAFCGAGRSAFFLHHVTGDGSKRQFNSLFGLGFWHPADTEALRTLFGPHLRAHSPYRLTDRTPITPAPSEVQLINMHDSFHFERSREYIEKVAFTNRIIRIYKQERKGEVSFNRYDFEPQLQPVSWSKERLEHLKLTLGEAMSGRPPSVVMVKDLLKNAVTLELVTWLTQELGKNARWYVSSKKWKPPWLDVLKSVELKLLLVPQVAAEEALREEARLTCWTTQSGHASKEALEQIDELRTRTGAEAIVIMPKDLRVLGRISENERETLIETQPKLGPTAVPMGGQSIFFPALCAGIEYQKHPNMIQIIEYATKVTDAWVKAEGQRVLEPRFWGPDPNAWEQMPELLNLSVAVPDSETVEDPSQWGCRLGPWDDALQNWEQAVKDDLPVIPTDGQLQLQLWRAAVEVDGYICCGSDKRRSLHRLVQGLHDFSANPQHHTAGMLVAAPGSGKSFLIERLAASTGLEPLPFNLTHLSNRSEIVGWFDTILSKQREGSGRRLLVFIDEVNTLIGGGSLYSAFLSPLEEGRFVRDGRTFELGPCAWIFAGTEGPKATHDNQAIQKGSDFASRLALGQTDLNAPGDREEATLERIYIGAMLLRTAFPDVHRVSESVLRAFAYLPEKVSIRDVRHFVRRFHNVQYTEVTSANVPKGSWPQDDKANQEAKWRQNYGPKGGQLNRATIQLVD